MPIKIGAILLLWFLQQIRNFTHELNEKYWNLTEQKISDLELDEGINRLLKESPIVRMHGFDCYQMRYRTDWVKSGEIANIDHFCARQGIYVGILNKLKMDTTFAAKALARCWTGTELRRGFHFANKDGGIIRFQDLPVSGDMLVGFCFGFIHDKHNTSKEMVEIARHLFENKGLKTSGKISTVANFKPGYQNSATPIPVGAQDITYLCGIMCGIKAIDYLRRLWDLPQYHEDLRQALVLEFNKRYWLYGGFLTTLFPTAGVWFRRGYNNDNVCIQASYILSRICDNHFLRFSFAASTFYTWSLSWPWLNSFFTGLTREVIGLIPRDYVNRCRHYSRDLSFFWEGMGDEPKKAKAKEWPIDPDKQQMSEFCGDEDHEFYKEGQKNIRSTLGQLAYIVWIKDGKN
jgi:hypothetical protein